VGDTMGVMSGGVFIKVDNHKMSQNKVFKQKGMWCPHCARGL